MSWADDLTVRLQNFSDEVRKGDSAVREFVGSDIYSFLNNQTKSAGIKLVPQLGNLSEQDLKDGLRGQAPGIPVANTPMAQLQNSLQAAGISPENQKYMMFALVGLGLVAIFSMFNKKRKRG